MTERRALLIQHVPHESCGWLEDLLDEAGVRLDVRRMWERDEVPAVADADAVVVLGGPMGAGDDVVAPWLPGVRALLADAVSRGTPTMGVCLGAQLLAVALGGTIGRGGAGPELGLCRVSVNEVAGEDPLFAGLTGEHDVVQWHWDEIVTLPPGATLLASSAAYPNQAFRVGDRAWATLFHPEVTLPLVAQWAQDDKDGVVAAGLDPTALVGAVAEAERTLLETWTPLLERFAALAAA